ncbi:hypothetical protein EYF80_012225 [Liparis tanakae]|uniref:Uncharacterized protein n=1 Tax=Liparis tanakae TaxID=230148 RepID=A0A4Z2IIR7_9TELE|nr:hypothetical protein EYF80_012225 [Liparis tanakae]
MAPTEGNMLHLTELQLTLQLLDVRLQLGHAAFPLPLSTFQTPTQLMLLLLQVLHVDGRGETSDSKSALCPTEGASSPASASSSSRSPVSMASSSSKAMPRPPEPACRSG